MKEYDGKVRVVYKHFVVHPDTAMDAHLAACAAKKQGKFVEFEHAFWEKGFDAYSQTRDASKLGKENIMVIAGEVGLDTDKLAAEMAGDECKQRIGQDMQVLRKYGVSGTPAFYVNGKFTMFSGPGPFKALIEKELAEAEKSGVSPSDYYQQVVVEGGLKEFRSAAGAEK